MYDLNTEHLNLPNDAGIDIGLLEIYIPEMVRNILIKAREKELFNGSDADINTLSLKAKDSALYTFYKGIQKGENENILTSVKSWTIGQTFIVDNTDIKISLVLMYNLNEDTAGIYGWSIICHGYLNDTGEIIDHDTLMYCVDKHCSNDDDDYPEFDAASSEYS